MKRSRSDCVKLPLDRAWLDYDRHADVLCVSFCQQQKATDSEMVENGVPVRCRGMKVVAATILDALGRP